MLLTIFQCFTQDFEDYKAYDVELSSANYGQEDSVFQWMNVRAQLLAMYQEKSIKPGFKERYNSKKFDYTEDFNVSTAPKFDSIFQLIGAILKYLGYIVLLGIVIFVIYTMYSESGGLFGRGSKIKGLYKIVEDIENFELADYESLANNAKSKGELKLAVRYYFLAYLQRLNEEKHIEFHKEKSNREYKYEIVDFQMRDDFSVLSRVFDYCWYGNRDLLAEQFQQAEALFKQRLKK